MSKRLFRVGMFYLVLRYPAWEEPIWGRRFRSMFGEAAPWEVSGASASVPRFSSSMNNTRTSTFSRRPPRGRY